MDPAMDALPLLAHAASLHVGLSRGLVKRLGCFETGNGLSVWCDAVTGQAFYVGTAGSDGRRMPEAC